MGPKTSLDKNIGETEVILTYSKKYEENSEVLPLILKTLEVNQLEPSVVKNNLLNIINICYFSNFKDKKKMILSLR